LFNQSLMSPSAMKIVSLWCGAVFSVVADELEADSLLQANRHGVADCAVRKDALLEAMSHHWKWALDENIIPDGQKVACGSLPRQMHNYFKFNHGNFTFCSDDAADHKIPSARDTRFYTRFVEAPCTVAVHLDAQGLAEFAFAGMELAEVDAYDNFNWDLLANYELIHLEQLEKAAVACQAVSHCIGIGLIQVPQPRTASLNIPVTGLRWKTVPVEQNRVAAQLGYKHSYLEVESNDDVFEFDVIPGRFGAKRLRAQSAGLVHAEASLAQIRAGVTVSEVFQKLRKFEETPYDLIHNNCHKFVQETFRWAAPHASAPASPNSNWEELAKTIDGLSPRTVTTLLQAAGASRRLGSCCRFSEEDDDDED